MKQVLLGFAVAWVAAGLTVRAAPTLDSAVTNDAAHAELEGRALAARLCALAPAESLTNSGVLKLRGKRSSRSDLPLQFVTRHTETNWTLTYVAATTNSVAAFSVTHVAGQPNQYQFEGLEALKAAPDLLAAFAGSDFWLLDLGTEFFQWPRQMLWKKELKNGQACDVLESRPTQPGTAGYSRVVCWIDQDTGGIVQAEAYDVRGKLLKEFEPKGFRKVNGEWRVEELVIRNVQTGTWTSLNLEYQK